MTARLVVPTTLLMAIVASRPLSACSCLATSPEQKLTQADAVVAGRVTWVRPAESSTRRWLRLATLRLYAALGLESQYLRLSRSFEQETEFGLLADIQVERSWKGAPSGQPFTVRTREQTTACGIPFQPGLAFLVYARHTSRGWEASSCGGSGQVRSASEADTIVGR